MYIYIHTYIYIYIYTGLRDAMSVLSPSAERGAGSRGPQGSDEARGTCSQFCY